MAEQPASGAVCQTVDRCSEQHSYGPGCLLAMPAYPSSPNRRLCGNCGEEIVQPDVTMQGSRGPWVHERTRTRLCSTRDGFAGLT